MADPLSVAGSAVGIISLGLTVCQGLIQYYVSWKGALEHVDALVESLQTFLQTLECLKKAITSSPFDTEIVAQVEGSINLCRHGVADLQQELTKVKRTGHSRLATQAQRLLYPFKESTLTRLQGIVSKLRDNLTFAMSTLHM